MAPYIGRTIALFGDTGSGKTTLVGQFAKHVRRSRGLNTLLNSSDLGGYDTISPLVRAGLVSVDELGPGDDPWIWINKGVTGLNLTNDIGVVAFDSGTSDGEALLSAASHAGFQIGQQATQTFKVNQGKETLSVSINNKAHYGLVQGFLLDAIWKSTWLTRKGVDVIWTFGTDRGEESDRTPILGPKLAGHALTSQIPKWFNYTFRVVSIPQDGAAPLHRLYLTEHQELAGMGHSFGNARIPLEAQTQIPAYIEPASILEAINIIDAAQAEADAAIAAEDFPPVIMRS